MSDEEKSNHEVVPPQVTAPPDPFPICPYCGADPLRIMFRQINAGNLSCQAVFCAECRKIVPLMLVQIYQPEGPRILRPH